MDSRTSLRTLVRGAGIAMRAPGPEDARHTAPNRQKHIRRPCASKKREARENGMVLVVLLMSVAVLTMLVVHMQVSARTELAGESRLLLHARLRAAADDAAWRSLAVLASDDNLLADHTNEPWAQPITLRLPDGIVVRAVMEDENRRLDLNSLSVAAAFAGARGPESIVAEMLRHTGLRDAENAAFALARAMETGARSNAAISASVQTNSAYIPRTVRLFESLEEVLGALPAAPPRDFFSLTTVLPDGKPRFTPINLNTAAPELLLALFGQHQRGLVEWLCIVRNGRPLESVSALTGMFPNARDADAFRACLDVKSRYFSLRVEAEAEGAVERILVLSERKDSGALRIHRWIRGMSGGSAEGEEVQTGKTDLFEHEFSN